MLSIFYAFLYFFVIPTIFQIKNEVIPKLISKNYNVEKYLPNELSQHLPKYLKQIKVPKKWVDILEVTSYLRNNKENLNKFQTGIYTLGKIVLRNSDDENNVLRDEYSPFQYSGEYPDLFGPNDPKLRNSLIKEVLKSGYKRHRKRKRG